MTDVVSAIQQVSTIVGQISAASTEQDTGMSQVGQAIVQIDQATQQNALCVHQSTETADCLQQQVQQLTQAVAVFQLDGAQPHLAR